jgi:putative oxidoreductase
LQHFFSTFVRGCPGAGLLLIRVVAGMTLVSRGSVGLWGQPDLGRATLQILSTGAGILLLVGLWTPVAGLVAAVIELWCASSRDGDMLSHVLLMTLTIASALVGPGAWSADARLFGWKRIDIRNLKG